MKTAADDLQKVGRKNQKVELAPLIDFDSILIADDFRAVRQFTKLFQFYELRGLLLMGNQSWRSPALLDPPEKMLQGSIFADFIPSFETIPQTLYTPLTEADIFSDPDKAAEFDYKIIGRELSNATSGFVVQHFKNRKNQMENLLKKAELWTTKSVNHSPNIHFPAYVFKIAQDGWVVAK